MYGLKEYERKTKWTQTRKVKKKKKKMKSHIQCSNNIFVMAVLLLVTVAVEWCVYYQPIIWNLHEKYFFHIVCCFFFSFTFCVAALFVKWFAAMFWTDYILFIIPSKNSWVISHFAQSANFD